jgi:uncharacterized protein
MIGFESHPEGTIIPVRAQPGSRKNELRGVHEGMLKVCVTQAPEKGKANKAIAEFLAKTFGVKKSQVELVAGEISHHKKFLVRGAAVEDLARKIDALLNY